MRLPFRAPSFACLALVLAAGVAAQKPTGGAPMTEEKPPAAPASPALTGTLIVLNKAEASASLINLADGREMARLATGAGPHEVAVSPDGATAVVADYGAQTPGNTLTVLDLKKCEVVRTIGLGEHRRPHGILFLPDGRGVVVTSEVSRHLLIVDLEAGVKHALPTEANGSHMVALSPDAKRAYVANIGSNSITAFDLEKNERLAVIDTGPQAEGIDVSPDGGEVWVSNRAGNTVSIVDAATLTVVATLDSPTFPIRVKFTPDGSHVLVSNAQSGDLSVFDAKARLLVRRVKMDEPIAEDIEGRFFTTEDFTGSPVPVGILVHPSGSHAFIANTLADVVTVVDLQSWRIVGRLKGGKEPDGLGYTPLVVTAE